MQPIKFMHWIWCVRISWRYVQHVCNLLNTMHCAMSYNNFVYEFAGTSTIGERSCLGVGAVSISIVFEFLIILSIDLC
jgi:hypothetical protein